MAKREGVWFLAEFDGNRAVLCKAHKVEKWNTGVRADIAGAKGKIEVAVAYDFFSPLRPIPMGVGADGKQMMGIGREKIVTGNHFMLEACPCYINMALVSKLTFLDEMTAFDSNEYYTLVDQAEANLEAQRRAASPLLQGIGGNDGPIKVSVDPDGIPRGTIDLRGMRGG